MAAVVEDAGSLKGSVIVIRCARPDSRGGTRAPARSCPPRTPTFPSAWLVHSPPPAVLRTPDAVPHTPSGFSLELASLAALIAPSPPPSPPPF
eukprot:scaffold20075_cov109-Isochrysis_galbana.AAC.5